MRWIQRSSSPDVSKGEVLLDYVWLFAVSLCELSLAEDRSARFDRQDLAWLSDKYSLVLF